MESVKHKHQYLVYIVVISISVALTSMGMSIYHEVRITELEKTQKQLQELITTNLLQVAPEELKDGQLRVRRSADSDSDPDDALSRLSLHDVLALRGPPGRDGRDGRDGKDCDLSEIEKLLSSPSVSTPTSSSSSQAIELDEESLLEKFNQTIGHALLRGIQSANRKLEALEHSSGSPEPSSSPAERVKRVDGGSTYVRWGRTSCTNTSQLLYQGFVAGQHYTHTGGASNYQCLPLQPEFSSYIAGLQQNHIYGAEYETGSSIFPQNMQDKNVPCARCYASSRSATMMIPAKRTCPTGWTKEYEGYLMAGHYSHKRAYAYECVDKEPEAIAGLTGNQNGALFYFQEIVCGSTGHCPPYIEGAELTCVVCTR